MGAPTILVLMGVSGSGKTTIGRLLSEKLHWPFFDADSFHPAENIAKMANGIPLTDLDRKPWLERIRKRMEKETAAGRSAIFGCSALKKKYRDFLRAAPVPVQFIYLRAAPALLSERLTARKGHFMKEEMLSSQLAAFEEPENAWTVDASKAPDAIISDIAERLHAKKSERENRD